MVRFNQPPRTIQRGPRGGQECKTLLQEIEGTVNRYNGLDSTKEDGKGNSGHGQGHGVR